MPRRVIPPVPVRGPISAAIVHRLLVLAHGIERLLAAEAAVDERRGYDLLALRIVQACEPSPCVPASIARSLLCRRQTALPIRERLLREGLVRPAVVSDRRCRGIRLTEDGRDFLEEADARLVTVGNAVLKQRDAEKRRVLAAVLHELEWSVREAIFDHEVTWGTDFRGRAARGRRTLGELAWRGGS